MQIAEIIGGYFCEKLQHWVKVIKPTKDNHKPRIHSKVSLRMKGAERKIAYEPKSNIEDHLKQEIVRFLIRKEEKLEKTKEGS